MSDSKAEWRQLEVQEKGREREKQGTAASQASLSALAEANEKVPAAKAVGETSPEGASGN